MTPRISSIKAEINPPCGTFSNKTRWLVLFLFSLQGNANCVHKLCILIILPQREVFNHLPVLYEQIRRLNNAWFVTAQAKAHGGDIVRTTNAKRIRAMN